jgi:hypothetical protein
MRIEGGWDPDAEAGVGLGQLIRTPHRRFPGRPASPSRFVPASLKPNDPMLGSQPAREARQGPGRVLTRTPPGPRQSRPFARPQARGPPPARDRLARVEAGGTAWRSRIRQASWGQGSGPSRLVPPRAPAPLAPRLQVRLAAGPARRAARNSDRDARDSAARPPASAARRTAPNRVDGSSLTPRRASTVNRSARMLKPRGETDLLRLCPNPFHQAISA